MTQHQLELRVDLLEGVVAQLLRAISKLTGNQVPIETASRFERLVAEVKGDARR